jgi:hypothetical protein
LSLGYDVARYKLLAFVLSTALAGLAGGLQTLVLGFAILSDAHWSLSGEVVLMTLLGGMGTFAGPVVGAFTIIGLQNLLADRVGAWVTVIIGAPFVVCVVVFRRGVMGNCWPGRGGGARRGEGAWRCTQNLARPAQGWAFTRVPGATPPFAYKNFARRPVDSGSSSGAGHAER